MQDRIDQLRATEAELLADIDHLRKDIRSTLVGKPQRDRLQAAYQVLAITRMALAVTERHEKETTHA